MIELSAIDADKSGVAYDYKSRGEGLAEYAAEGSDIRSSLIDLISRTSVPLLEAADLAALDNFLHNAPARDDRRTAAQRSEGARLIGLIEASTTNALVDEARFVLCKWLRGKSSRQRGRPLGSKSPFSDVEMCRLWATWIKQHVEDLLRQKAPLDIPRWGVVEDDPDWAHLSFGDHAMLIAHKALRDRGYSPPSIRTLRNNLINFPLRDLFVNDPPPDV